MSHMEIIDLHVLDLNALATTCQKLGLVVEQDRSDWRWFGSWMNDYHAQEAAYRHGIKPDEYGKCADHVITLPGDDQAFEIGVVRCRDGRPGWMLCYDNWSGGRGMTAKIGENAAKLKQYYAVVAAYNYHLSVGEPARLQTDEVTGNLQCVAEVTI